MDAMGPECDVMGNYKLVQCSFAFCMCQDRTGTILVVTDPVSLILSIGAFAQWAGENNVDNVIPGMNMDFPVKYCLGLLTSNGWTINGPKE